MTLGNRLKRIREIKGLSQMEVAEKIGESNAVLSNYERNYRDPATHKLLKLAKVYNVSIDYLLGEIDVPEPLNRENYNFKQMFINSDTIETELENLLCAKRIFDLLINFNSTYLDAIRVSFDLAIKDLEQRKKIDIIYELCTNY